MQIYRYVAVDEAGRRVRGTLMAEDTAEFMRLLGDKRLYCESYKVKWQHSAGRVAYRMKAGDLVVFCRQLGIMLKAGMQLPNAMAIVCEKTDNPYQRELYERMSASLHAGGMLSDAIREQGKAFPEMMVQMVAAAELSGTMDEIMDGLAGYYEREKDRNAKAKSASTYPAILFILLIVMLLAIFTFVMPRLLPLMSGSMSAGMRVLVAITNFVRYKWYVLVLIVMGVVLLGAVLRSFSPARLVLDRLRLKLPVLGKLLKTMYVSRFSEAFATLYRSGIRVNDAMTMSAATVINQFFTSRCSEARRKVDAGAALSSALGETGLFDSMFTSMLHVGEESGEMQQVLTRMAAYYDKEGQAAMNRAVDMLQPIFIIIMGLLIGSIVIIIMTSVYGMYANMGI